MKSSEYEQLKKECSRVDDWANGVFLALNELLMALAHEQPEVVRRLEPQWKKAYDDYNRADQNRHVGQSARLLEARKMLYGHLKSSGAFDLPPRE